MSTPATPAPSPPRATATAIRPGSAVDRLVRAVRDRPWVVDTALAVLALAVGLWFTASGHVPRADRAEAVVVAVLAAAPIAWRRRRPVPVAAAVAVVAVVSQLALPGTSAAILLSILVVGYSAVAYGPRWAGPLTAAVIVLGSVLPLARLLTAEDVGGDVVGAAWFLLVLGLLVGVCTWFAGALRRAHLHSVAQLRERARLLEEGRRREVRLELMAERSRISREVHDVVAHSLSGIIAQADGGQYAAVGDPQRAVDVLADIAAGGREALADIRGLLGTLRSAAPSAELDEAHPDPGAARPGLEDVAVLVEQVRAGGMPITLTVNGDPHVVSSGTGLAVYRVVQESLTNVVKHAGHGATTEVLLDWGDDELAVVVRDDGGRGARPSAPRGGHGLVGMRERAALLGGSVHTAQRAGGGFVVHLRLPVAITSGTTGASPTPVRS